MKLWAIGPELILAGLCLVLVPVAGFARGRARSVPPLLAGAGLLACVALTGWMLSWEPVMAFHGAYAIDGLATAFKLIVTLASLITLLLLWPYFRGRLPIAHAPIALLFSTLGAVGLLSSNDLGLIVLFLQMMSMGGYVLIAMRRGDRGALEATLKYFLYGAVALAVMAYGLTFLYGLTGSLRLDRIGAALSGAHGAWVGFALILILAGYGFEIAMVPVHLWAPDTFAGASAPVSGFLSVVPKSAAVGALLRFLLEAIPPGAAGWPWIIAGASVLSMTLGNLVALRQTRLKRLLAWSSIAQAGYVLAAVAVSGRAAAASSAAAFYVAVYAFMNLGAFGVAAQLERSTGDDAIESARGLLRRNPWATAVLTLSLLSLAGIPPLAGFAGKVLVFAALFDGDMTWLAAIAAANMVVAIAYYLRVIAPMFLSSPRSRSPLFGGGAYAGAYGLSLAGTFLLGILPQVGLVALGRAAPGTSPALTSKVKPPPTEVEHGPDRTQALGDRRGLHPGVEHRAGPGDDQPRDRLSAQHE